MAPAKAPVQTADAASLRAQWSKQKELASLRRVFGALDSDRDGQVSEKELNAALVRIGYRPKPGEVANMIWEVDEDCNGCVGWEEFQATFLRYIGDKTGLEPRELFQVVEFMMHDVDQGGTISQDELMEILFSRFGSRGLAERVEAFFPKAADGGVEGEQAISFAEFRQFMDAIKPKRKTNKEKAKAMSRRSAMRTQAPARREP
jgi:calmodulin